MRRFWPQRAPSDGSLAREHAQRTLEHTKSRWPEVHAVTSSLRDLRERNHFAEQIEAIMRGVK
jgi:hypothetical protein